MCSTVVHVQQLSANVDAAEALAGEHDIDLAEQGAAEAIPEPAQTRAQAVQQAILQASDSITSSIPLHVPAEDNQSSAEDSDSENNDDLLAKLSQSMFAALRPKAGSQDAGYRAMESSTAERDSLRAFQPDVVQPDCQQASHGSLHCLNDLLRLLAELHPVLCGFNPLECRSSAVNRLDSAANGA